MCAAGKIIKVKSKHFRALGANWIHRDWKIKIWKKMDSFYRGQENNILLHFHFQVFWTQNYCWNRFSHTKAIFNEDLWLWLFVIRTLSIRFPFSVWTHASRERSWGQSLHTNNPASSYTCSCLLSFPSVVASSPLRASLCGTSQGSRFVIHSTLSSLSSAQWGSSLSGLWRAANDTGISFTILTALKRKYFW